MNLRVSKSLGFLNLSFGALRERKVRSSLTILMVVMGVSLITTLNSMNAGFTNFVDDQLKTLGSNVLIVTTSPTIQRFGGRPLVSQLTLNYNTLNTVRPIPGVKDVIPFVRGNVMVSSGGSKISAIGIGLDPSKLGVVVPSLRLEQGELIKPQDTLSIIAGGKVVRPDGSSTPLVEYGKVVTLEYSVVEDRGHSQRAVTKSRGFIAAGILKVSGTQLLDNSLFFALPAGEALFKKGRFDGIYVITEDQSVNDSVEARIKEVYGDNISVTSQKALMQTIETLVSGFRGFVLGIAGVSLLVGGVGIVTTLYTSVMERTREIGLLKSLGFTNLNVMRIFLGESTIIGALGGGLGTGLGVVMAEVVTKFVTFNPDMPPIIPVFLSTDMWNVFLLSLGLSILAGLYPAWKAASLTPVVALRKE